MGILTKEQRITTLDEVLDRLSKELNISKVEDGKNLEIYRGFYTITLYPAREGGKGLQYEDRVVCANFEQTKYSTSVDPSKDIGQIFPTLYYHVWLHYFEGQINVLRRTKTKIGRKLSRVLAEMKENLKLGENASSRKPDRLCTMLKLPDYSEAYDFILGHIRYARD